MMPEKIVRFLERANVAYAGTRDANLVPHGHHVSGWTVGANARTITALIPAASTPHLVDSLLDNGQFSMTTEEYPAHEAYQFKGKYVRHRPVLPDEIEVVDRIRERFLKAVKAFFPPDAEQWIRAYIVEPSVAVEFDVREVYLQTPGPGAGARILPEESPA